MGRKEVMKTMLMIAALAVPALSLAVPAKAQENAMGRVFRPADGTSFEISSKDVVRFDGPSPGSTGYKTTVKVTAGEATVTERATFEVKDGKVLTIGGGALEFDVRPKPNFKGTIKVTVSSTPPGKKKPMEKKFEFDVK